jgi:hypothetical protein
LKPLKNLAIVSLNAFGPSLLSNVRRAEGISQNIEFAIIKPKIKATGVRENNIKKLRTKLEVLIPLFQKSTNW